MLTAFYARRALRIAPAFYLTLALALLAGISTVRNSLWWHATYLSNVWIFVRAQWPGDVSHLWSLAVEEQFYVGRISYGVYLAHGFAGAILAAVLSSIGAPDVVLPEPLRFLALTSVTLAAAALSWHYVEAPINALKARVPYRFGDLARAEALALRTASYGGPRL